MNDKLDDLQSMMEAHISGASHKPANWRPDVTNLAYWFPIVQGVHLPVPRTAIIHTNCELLRVLDYEAPPPHGFDDFIKHLTEVAESIGGAPLFLRTGHTSGKHDWKNCCAVTDLANLRRHVFSLVEFSAMCCFEGLPVSTWVVREMLPVKHLDICPRYGNMPVVREFRAFVDGGKFLYLIPYWPQDALNDGGATLSADQYQRMCHLSSDEEAEIRGIAVTAGNALGGRWSVDVLDTERGWVLTDMAEAERSWGWKGDALVDPNP